MKYTHNVIRILLATTAGSATASDFEYDCLAKVHIVSAYEEITGDPLMWLKLIRNRFSGGTAKCAGKEQATPAASVQPFAYIIPGSVS